MEGNTIKKVLDYYFTEDDYSKEVRKALSVFFDRYPTEELDAFDEGALSEWFLYDFRLKNGRTPIENYYTRNPMGLSKGKLQVYKELRNSIYGIWKVRNVIKNVGLELVNAKNNDAYGVKEHKGSLTMKKGDYIHGRVAKISDIYELVGADPRLVPKELVKTFRKELVELNPKTVRDYYYEKREEKMASKA